ncbi:MAG: chromate resistance protein, partial [Chloroflexi bacterium]
MHYVTREHIHVDRPATAWAIRRFVDPGATFGFVPRSVELNAIDGIPFDLRGAELGHRRGRCTLDALI